MKTSLTKFAAVAGLALLGIALGAGGIYVGQTDDAPGAALIGFLLMILVFTAAVKTARNKP